MLCCICLIWRPYVRPLLPERKEKRALCKRQTFVAPIPLGEVNKGSDGVRHLFFFRRPNGAYSRYRGSRLLLISAGESTRL